MRPSKTYQNRSRAAKRLLKDELEPFMGYARPVSLTLQSAKYFEATSTRWADHKAAMAGADRWRRQRAQDCPPAVLRGIDREDEERGSRHR